MQNSTLLWNWVTCKLQSWEFLNPHQKNICADHCIHGCIHAIIHAIIHATIHGVCIPTLTGYDFEGRRPPIRPGCEMNRLQSISEGLNQCSALGLLGQAVWGYHWLKCLCLTINIRLANYSKTKPHTLWNRVIRRLQNWELDHSS